MMETNRTTNYVYIAGHGHSGSTLLEMLLCSHPKMVAMGELDKLSLQFARGSRPCGCGRLPTECRFWREVCKTIQDKFSVDIKTDPFRFRVSDVGLEEDYGIRAFHHWLPYHYTRLWRYLGYSHVPMLGWGAGLLRTHKCWAQNRLFVADVIRQLSHASITIDSSKDYIGARDMYRVANGQMKIIFLTRDVRGVVWSHLKLPRGTLQAATRSWVKSNRRTWRMLKGIPANDWIQLKYEDLCADVVGTSKRLCDFLGIEFDQSMIEFKHEQNHTIAGNKIRSFPIDSVREDFTWKKNLTAEDLYEIVKIASSFTRTLGYSCEVNQ